MRTETSSLSSMADWSGEQWLEFPSTERPPTASEAALRGLALSASLLGVFLIYRLAIHCAQVRRVPYEK
jgi:hypothetical protein